MQKQTVQGLIDEMVSVVERRAWSEYEVADVLFDVCQRVSQDEVRSKRRRGSHGDSLRSSLPSF